MAVDQNVPAPSMEQVLAFGAKGFTYTVKGKGGEKDRDVQVAPGTDLLKNPALLREARSALIASLTGNTSKGPRKTRESRICHFLLINEDREVINALQVKYDQRLERRDTRETFKSLMEYTPGSSVVELVQGPKDKDSGMTPITIMVDGPAPVSQVVRLLASGVAADVIFAEEEIPGEDENEASEESAEG